MLAQQFMANPKLANLQYFGKFYMRRLKRIIPMYYITIISFVILVPSFIGEKISIIKHLIFMQANGHLWSTQQEICFYIICPILFYLNFILVKKINLSNLILFALLMLESLLFNMFLTTKIFYLNGNGKPQAFYISIFLIGIVFSYLIKADEFKRIIDNKYLTHILSFISFGSILIYFFSAKYYKELIGIFQEVDYLGWKYPIFFSILTGILILTVTLNKNKLLMGIFNVKILRSFGKVSYSMYLIHYLLLQFLNKHFENNLLFYY